MEKFNQIIVGLLAPAISKTPEEIEALIESPQDASKGDRALPCFRWANEMKSSPQKLAEKWRDTVCAQLLPKEIEKIEVAGGYLNFFFKRAFLATEVLKEIHAQAGKYGFAKKETAPIAIVEFSSPNIAKPFSIGHLRSTNIGASISRIFEARGWRVVRLNHLGDWGTQFGKLMSAYRRWGNAELLDEHPIQKLYKLYVRWHEEEISDPTLIEEAREWFARLERGDEEAKELWTWFRDLTLRELKQLYEKLSVDFDYYWGESFYIEKVEPLLNELNSKGITKESEDATIIDLEELKLGICVLQKSDDTSLYLTRDIAAAIYRNEQFHFDRMLYVVGTPQRLHFQQLFKVLELMGHKWSDRCEHVSFGHISFGDEAMSTRKGNVVFLSDVLARAKEMALKIVEEKNPELVNKERIAEDVGLAAILFADVSSKRIKDVRFTWEDILSFDGETGPYIQYSLVRTQSLLRRYDRPVEPKTGNGLLESDEEAAVIRQLSMFPSALARAEEEREPFYVAQYLITLARTFNKFYTVHRILDAPEEIAKSRVFLTRCVCEVMQSGLKLLGIPILERM
jgi:arginyl-tRNA synthetase